jgi:hypothetical protein
MEFTAETQRRREEKAGQAGTLQGLEHYTIPRVGAQREQRELLADALGGDWILRFLFLFYSASRRLGGEFKLFT